MGTTPTDALLLTVLEMPENSSKSLDAFSENFVQSTF